MRTLLTRALAGIAIATASVLTAAGTASAAPRVSVPTTLSITDTRAVIKLGQTDIIGGTLRSGAKPLAAQIVLLEELVKGKLIFLDARFTDTSGNLSFLVRPRITTFYELVFQGSPGFERTSSGIAKVVVLQPPKPRKQTILTIGDIKVSIHPGQSDTVFGGLISGQSPLAGQLVWLYQIVNGQLVNGDGHFTNKFGVVYFSVSPSATTHYELKFFGTGTYASAHSQELTVLVK